MFKLDPKDLKEYVLKHWAAKYGIDRDTDTYKEVKYDYFQPKTKLELYLAVKALPNDCSAEDIRKAGMGGWSSEYCSFCGKIVSKTDTISNEDTDSWDVFHICRECVNKAKEMFDGP